MKLEIINVPLNYGCQNWGTAKCYEYLKANGLIELLDKCKYEYVLNENIKQVVIYDQNNLIIDGCKYKNEIIDTCNLLAQNITNSYENNNFPIIIGGDHSLAMGSIAAFTKQYPNQHSLIWVDAHTDINTEKTSDSKNVHGMPIAASLGICASNINDVYYTGKKIKGDDVHIFGARSIDEGEYINIALNNVNLYSDAIIKQTSLIAQLDTLIKNNRDKKVHLSFDVDVIDCDIFYATGTCETAGMSVSDVKYVLKRLITELDIVSMDIVEYSPILDKDKNNLKIVLDIIQMILENLKITNNEN